MTKSKFYLITLLTAILLSVVLGSSSSFASDTSSTNQAEPTISVPVSQWNELKSNNAKSVELNRSIQRSIDRSTDYSREAATRIERSSQYNQQIGERINASQTSINEAKRNCLVEMQNSLTELKGQIDNDKRTIKRLRMQRNLSQILGSGCDNRSSNSSMTER